MVKQKLESIFPQKYLIPRKQMGLVAALLIGSSNIEAKAEDFIEGVVKGERYVQKTVDPNFYTFSVETTNEFKTFNCYGDKASAKLDSIINPGDKVKIKLSNGDNYRRQQSPNEKEYNIDTDQVVEVNGKKLDK